MVYRLGELLAGAGRSRVDLDERKIDFEPVASVPDCGESGAHRKRPHRGRRKR
jgi:hypothetical protein